jgi:glyoxylase-like metal-dependent hydrolase (beta-lactamase superfamily II)
MSYLIGDPGSGVAAVVDPTEDPGAFLAEAGGLGLRIERVIETHMHQDHVPGAKATTLSSLMADIIELMRVLSAPGG